MSLVSTIRGTKLKVKTRATTLTRYPCVTPFVTPCVTPCVRHGVSKSIEGKANLQKTKNSAPICLFLFSNNVDLKNNNRECRKPF